jgi:hypothetical protein
MEFLAVSCRVFKTFDSANADPAKTASDSANTKTVQAIFFKLLTPLRDIIACAVLILLNSTNTRGSLRCFNAE